MPSLANVHPHIAFDRAARASRRVAGLLFASVLFLVPDACGSQGGTRAMSHALEEFYDPHSSAGRLAAAAGRGDSAQVAQLVKAGADPNAPGRDGMLPLHWAYMARSEAGGRALLAAGADPNRRNLAQPAMRGSGAGVSPIAFAVADRDARWIALYLAHGGDPNGPGHDGEPLIFDAITAHDLPRVRTLVERGAHLNARGAANQTPVILAADLNQYPIVQYLLEQGADWRVESDGGLTLAMSVQDAQISPEFPEMRQALEWTRAYLVKQGVVFPVEEPWQRRKRDAQGPAASVTQPTT